MKKVIALGIAGLMVMGLAVAASAGIDTDWQLNIRAYNEAGANSQGVATFGTKIGGNDGPNFVAGANGLLAPQNASGTLVGVYTKWLKQGTATKSTSTDLRTPITTVGASKVWQIYVTGGTGFTDNGNTNYTMKIWNDSTNAAYAIDGGIDLALYSVSTFGGARTLVWHYDANSATSEAGADYAWTSSDVTAGGQNFLFEMVATGVNDSPILTPEPGSIVAMLSGLVGLAGFGIRRRK